MRYIKFVIICLWTCSLKAQHTKFITEGTIEFERKIKLSVLFEEENPTLEVLKKNGQYFKTNFFTLKFDSTKCSYKPGKENPENYKLQKLPAEENTVSSDIKENIIISQKQLFENNYIVSDTLNKKIQWKITSEKRKIAGFECKRANAIILDSIYIIAYFTEEILSQSGPESFRNLPGMILGVAIPHEHISWFATKLIYEKKENSENTEIFGKEVISCEQLKSVTKNNLSQESKLDNWLYKFIQY